MDIQTKIHQLDQHLKRALISDDIALAKKILHITFKFIAQNPSIHKPTFYTLKYAALTIQKSLQLVPSPPTDQSMHAEFVPFYNLIIKNMEYIPPEIELIIIDILNWMDIAIVMKYFETTPQNFIHINSFQFMLHQLIEPTDGRQYVAVIKSLIDIFFIQKPHSLNYQWLLPYISNDLLWYIMQYDFGLALRFLRVSMDYDIQYRQKYQQPKSFIDFSLIQAAFKLIRLYDPNGLNFKQGFLGTQQVFVKYYTVQNFHPAPQQNDIQELFLELMWINGYIYKSFYDVINLFRFGALRNKWGLQLDHELRSVYLNSALNFCQYATQNHLRQWV